MKVTLVSHTPDPQRLIETCARISYDSKNEPFDPKVNSEFIRKLIRNGHESPLEHASATFLIEGVSRTCSHQIVRHRLASFTEKSERYVEITEDDVVVPGRLKEGVGDTVVTTYERASLQEDYDTEIEAMLYSGGPVIEGMREYMDQICHEGFANYACLVREGLSKEDARLFLPQITRTSLYMTANFREWRHFLKLRLDRHAQWEIRAVACEVYEKLSEIAQDVFEDLASEYQSNFVAGG